jgi:hypothetical protein
MGGTGEVRLQFQLRRYIKYMKQKTRLCKGPGEGACRHIKGALGTAGLSGSEKGKRWGAGTSQSPGATGACVWPHLVPRRRVRRPMKTERMSLPKEAALTGSSFCSWQCSR